MGNILCLKAQACTTNQNFIQNKALESNKIRNNDGIPNIFPFNRPLGPQRGVPPATFQDKARAEAKQARPPHSRKVIAISQDST